MEREPLLLSVQDQDHLIVFVVAFLCSTLVHIFLGRTIAREIHNSVINSDEIVAHKLVEMSPNLWRTTSRT